MDLPVDVQHKYKAEGGCQDASLMAPVPKF